MADLGVRVFFVLSGFLITTRLLRERELTGEISLSRFYWRRGFRILPAVYAYVLGTCLLAAAGVTSAPGDDVAYAATFTMNFHSERAWSLGHLWSLGVEEQFYLLWPPLLVAFGRERSGWLALIAVALAPIARLSAWYLVPAFRPLSDQAFPCVFDTLACGCFLAIARERLEKSPRYMRMLDSRLLLPAATLAMSSTVVATPWLGLGPLMSISNIAIAILLHASALRRQHSLTNVLEAPLAIRLGVISYSLYLWQQVFLNRHGSAWFNAFPVNVALAVAIAALSYKLIELPFQRLSKKLFTTKRGAHVIGALNPARPSPPPSCAPSYSESTSRAITGRIHRATPRQ